MCCKQNTEFSLVNVSLHCSWTHFYYWENILDQNKKNHLLVNICGNKHVLFQCFRFIKLHLQCTGDGDGSFFSQVHRCNIQTCLTLRGSPEGGKKILPCIYCVFVRTEHLSNQSSEEKMQMSWTLQIWKGWVLWLTCVFLSMFVTFIKTWTSVWCRENILTPGPCFYPFLHLPAMFWTHRTPTGPHKVGETFTFS